MTSDEERARQPGTSIGLGRVVDNPSGMGTRDQGSAGGAHVEEASEDSFPASDPPAFASDKATPGGRGTAAPDAAPDPEAGAGEEGDLPGTELPDPEDRV